MENKMEIVEYTTNNGVVVKLGADIFKKICGSDRRLLLKEFDFDVSEVGFDGDHDKFSFYLYLYLYFYVCQKDDPRRRLVDNLAPC